MNPVSGRHRVDSAEQNPRCSDEYARGQGSTSVSGPLTAVRGGAGQEGTDDDKRCANCSDDAPMVGARRTRGSLKDDNEALVISLQLENQVY